MNELAKRWIEALDGDDYKQTRAKLQDVKGGMCCLGVLCDVKDPNAWQAQRMALCGDAYAYGIRAEQEMDRSLGRSG